MTNGLKIQWGNIATAPSTNPYSLIFPIMFSNSYYSIHFQTISNYSPRDFGDITEKDSSHIKFKMEYNGSATSSPFTWFAIGY